MAMVTAVCLWLMQMLAVFPNHAAAAEDSKFSKQTALRLSRLLGPQDSAMVTAPDGRIVVALHENRLLIPASILKVLTALAALHYLGADYRYTTDFFLTPQNDLVIKGFGDPLLVSERLAEIARHLAGQVQEIGSVILDDSYFAYPIVIPGRTLSNEPYDAPNGALCVNFNTVFFKRRNGRWVSAEPQTPLLPSIIPKIEHSGLRSGRINLAHDRVQSLQYAGELFRYFLNKAGISTRGTIRQGVVDPGKDRLLWRYRSPSTLTEVIADLLAFSNNFIANQLLLTIGADTGGAPATVDKGMQALRRYYHEVLGIKTGQLVEASGISRSNRVSARAMMLIVETFEPRYRLLRHDGRQWYKTGTLKGIHTRIGFLESADGGRYRFVVMINTPGRTTDPIMRLLERELK